MDAQSLKPELLLELIKYFLRKFGNSKNHQQIIREQISAKLNRGPLSAADLNEIEEAIKAKLCNKSTNTSVILPEVEPLSSRGSRFFRKNSTLKQRSTSVLSNKSPAKISPEKCRLVLEQFHRLSNFRFHSMDRSIKSPFSQGRYFEKNKINQWGMISLAQDLKNKKEEQERLLNLSEQKKAYREIIKQQIQERIDREQCERNRQIEEEEGLIKEDQNYALKLQRARENKRLQRIDQERRDQQITDNSQEKAHLRRFEKEMEQKEMAQFMKTAKVEDQKKRRLRFQANRHVQRHNLIKMLMKHSKKDDQTNNSTDDISVALAVEGERRKMEFTKKMEMMERKTQTVMEKAKSKSFMELQQESAQRAERERIKIDNSFQKEISDKLQKQEEKRKNYIEGLKKFTQEQQAIQKKIKTKFAIHCQEVREQAESYSREVELQKKNRKKETHKYSAILRDQIKERLIREEKSKNELSQIEVEINKPFLEKLGLTE